MVRTRRRIWRQESVVPLQNIDSGFLDPDLMLHAKLEQPLSGHRGGLVRLAAIQNTAERLSLVAGDSRSIQGLSMSVASDGTSAHPPAELTLFSAVAVRPVLLGLISDFERDTGVKVAATFELNPAIKRRIEAGEPFDVVVLNADLLDDLQQQGRVVPDARRPFGRVGLGVAMRAGAPKPDVSSVDALMRTLVNAKSIAYTAEGSSGAHFTALLARLGILEAVRPQLRSVGGGETGHVVARGEAELGVVPVTTILVAAPGAELAGLFPAELQSYIDFAIGLGAAARNPRDASALIGFLTGAGVDEVLRSKGVERIP